MEMYESRYYRDQWPKRPELQILANRWFGEAVERYGTAYEGFYCLCRLHCDDDFATCIADQRAMGWGNAFDHSTEFKRNGRTTAIIGQPYGPLDAKSLAALDAYCRARGVKVEFGSAAWHYPGRTVALIFTRVRQESFDAA